ncbi:LicD family protein [Roseovarius aestuarii]|nr:LicD family protein [Roseovarius aestuarii]
MESDQGTARRKSLTMSAAIEAARAAREEGRDDVSINLLEECLTRVPTSSVVLTDLASHRLQQGALDTAKTLIKRAIILNPSYQPATQTYLRLHQATQDQTPLKGALLARFKSDMAVVWAFCKLCRSKADLDEIFKALAPNGPLPAKYIRAVGNAALRVDQFDLGRSLYLRAIKNASEKLSNEVKPAKSIGDGGTQALVDIVRLLKSANVPHFAAAGTCLGLVREGRPLPHDNDIDIGIMEEDFDQAKLMALANASPLFTSSLPHPKTPKVGLKHINGVEIDLFKFYRENGKIWHNGVFVRWGNRPFELESRTLDGTEILIPSGTPYLVENYGENWDRPDPMFNSFLNGANREVIWDEFYAAHVLRTINITLREGALAKAAHFIRQETSGPYLTRLEQDVLRVIAQIVDDELAQRAADSKVAQNG